MKPQEKIKYLNQPPRKVAFQKYQKEQAEVLIIVYRGKL